MRHVQVLNPDYSQARGRKEMFEKFRTKSEHVAPENLKAISGYRPI